MSFKLLHTADLHLGMTFQSRQYSDHIRQQLVEARYESLEKIIMLARDEGCDLIIIAGDLFHRINISAKQVSRTLDILKKFPGIIAVLPGNHDYYEPHNQLWEALSELSFEELYLLTECRPYNLNESGLDLTLYPAPCDSKHSAENKLGWIRELPEKPQSRWHIGVAHGTIQGVSPDFKDQYYPMDEKELSTIDLDHWCLGHTHVPYPNQPKVGKQAFIYSGTPEPDGFDCRHPGSVWITDFDDQGHVHSSLVETGQFRFSEVHQEISSRNDLLLLRDQLAANSTNKLVKLKLSGVMPEADYQERSLLLEEIREHLFYLEVDDTSLAIELSPEVISHKFPEGSFPHKLLSKLAAEDDKDALQLAYSLIEEVKQ